MPEPGPVGYQPVPEPAASALIAGLPLDQERGWLRRTLSREFDAVASTIGRVLSEHPGLNGDGAAVILADSVAVRLYLSAQGAAIDAALRSARKGPHVPFARCVVAGLARLPSHRGATVFATSPQPGEWELLRSGRPLTEWGFVNALTAPSPDLGGTADVLVWSMTARRTQLLEPGGDDAAQERVLFVPGTSFKVLHAAEPSGDGRGLLLLRELSTTEIDRDGRVDSNRVSLDELATTSLRRCADRWSAGATPPPRVGAAARARFDCLPGLVR